MNWLLKSNQRQKRTEKNTNSMLTPLFVRICCTDKCFEGDNLHSFNNI